MPTRLIVLLMLAFVTACSSEDSTPEEVPRSEAGPQARPDPEMASGPTQDTETPGERLLLEIDSETATCTGVGKQECMKIRAPGEEEWRLFYGSIQGFVFEPGLRSVVEGERTRVRNPPADASSLRYRLVEVVRREPVS